MKTDTFKVEEWMNEYEKKIYSESDKHIVFSF